MYRHLKAKRLGGFQIDHQLEFDRGLHGKLAWLFALKNAINIGRRAPKIIGQVISVGQQAADFSEGSLSRRTASLAGFLDLSHVFDGPLR